LAYCAKAVFQQPSTEFNTVPKRNPIEHVVLTKPEKSRTMTLDRTDRGLIELLQQNGRMANADLARAVHLSPTPCLRRVKALESTGVITGYRAIVDRRKLGFGVRAFVGVTRDKSVDRRQLWHRMTTFPEVIGCYVISGEFDLLLDVIAKDLDAYSNSLLEKILSVPGIIQVRSMFVMKEVTEDDTLPVDSW